MKRSSYFQKLCKILIYYDLYLYLAYKFVLLLSLASQLNYSKGIFVSLSILHIHLGDPI